MMIYMMWGIYIWFLCIGDVQKGRKQFKKKLFPASPSAPLGKGHVRREEFKAVGEEFWQRKKENKKNPEVRRALPVAVGEAAVTVNQRRDGVKVSPSGGLTLGERSPTARDPALGEERLRRQQIPRASFADGHARRSFRRRFWALRRRFLTLGELAVSSSELLNK